MADSIVILYDVKLELDLPDIVRSRSLGTCNNVKADPGAFGEGLEAFSLDGGVMDKHIIATVLLNETKAL